MTISSHVRELNDRLSNLERCAEMAPECTYERGKEAAAAIADASNAILAAFRAHGFNAGNDDRLRNIEAALYGYLLQSNSDEIDELRVSEGFGEHVDGPAGSRVIAQAIQNREALAVLRSHQ